MKVALISDLHSNREALEAVFDHIRAQGIDRIFCLGDIVGYGAEPEFCVDLVRGHAEVSLMGNHDDALFHGGADFNPHARGAIDFTRARMCPHWYSGSERKARWKWMQNLEFSYREGRFLFVHGSPRDPVREYVLSTDGMLNPDKLREVFDSFDGIALGGHTHYPGIFWDDLQFSGLGGRAEHTVALPEGKQAFINIGSVGQPRDNDNRACYAVLEDHQVTWHRVPYDYRATMEKILATGVLSEMLARRLQMGK